MAIAHTRMKALSRSRGNTVRMLAYRAGTYLRCPLTKESFDYTHKPVAHVELLLPLDAPLWSIELQELIAQDRHQGVQAFADLAESHEKRVDSQPYREWEFALPRELTNEQCIALARDYMQNQACSRGMTVLLNFHFDVGDDGERKPHCHAVMLTRHLTEIGLSRLKERAWERRELAQMLREQFANYTNAYLEKHGFDVRIDHRSYAEQGIALEPQSKLGRWATRMEELQGYNPRHTPSLTVSDKGTQFQQIRLRNLYRLLKQPTLILDMVTKQQATFMWGDVEAVLGRYIDDPVLYANMNAQLKESTEVVLLSHHELKNAQGHIRHYPVYTTRAMLQREHQLVTTAITMHQTASHSVDDHTIATVIEHWQQKFAAHGGLSPDQHQAIQAMVASQQLATIVGYAGAGKTTVLEAAKDIWQASHYPVYGLAPTGRAAQNLQDVGIPAQTLHKFLRDYSQGRNHWRKDTILVLDEAGMVDVVRFQELLTLCAQRGFKLVTVGDGAQLQAVEAGAAFRLITERTKVSRLEHVVRQRTAWQREATQRLGRCETAKAIEQYYSQGCIHIVDEDVPEIGALIAQKDNRAIIKAFNTARRVTGTLYADMDRDWQQLQAAEHAHAATTLKQDKHPILNVKIDPATGTLSLSSDQQNTEQKPLTFSDHPDYEFFLEWRERRQLTSHYIMNNIDACRELMAELGVDPFQFVLPFIDRDEGDINSGEAARALMRELKLLSPPAHITAPVCDIREQTRATLLQAWQQSVVQHPQASHIILSYANSDVQALNQQARHFMREQDKLGVDVLVTVSREHTNDFGEVQSRYEQRAFAVGDRLLFTKNDNRLQVKNGMLGTITDINKQKITVNLDGDERTVSFAPRLYDHIDHGYATTIHKAQGVTVDYSFVLATHQTFRNLAYVGLTRHRDSVHVFASNLDFSRPEKTWEVMERSREKVSSLDYIDTTTAYNKMRHDETYIERKLQDIRNHIQALKVMPVEAWQRIGERFLKKQRELFYPVKEGVFTEQDRAELLHTQHESLSTKIEKTVAASTPALLADQHRVPQESMSIGEHLPVSKPEVNVNDLIQRYSHLSKNTDKKMADFSIQGQKEFNHLREQLRQTAHTIMQKASAIDTQAYDASLLKRIGLDAQHYINHENDKEKAIERDKGMGW